jgi:hypothetical protein
MNPIYLEKELEFKKNFTLTLVKKANSSFDNLYIELKKFCQMNSISFIVRDYNSSQFEEDCDYITKLPAIHIYMRKKGYLETFYPSDTYQTNIEKLIEKKEYEEEYKKKNKKSIFSYLRFLLS